MFRRTAALPILSLALAAHINHTPQGLGVELREEIAVYAYYVATKQCSSLLKIPPGFNPKRAHVQDKTSRRDPLRELLE
ncbi:hypothetical protein HDU86_000800 [Geranomyces michiganensis]|nr:hypothetical protein HDU86_000800 [Geranomyces michiganensis]